MVIFNYSEKQISAKIVYYGPGLGGKTTSLAYIHDILDDKDRGEMLSLATDADRTLYFDYLPVSIGKINDILNIKLQLYTVPGQIRYNNTRRVVLGGADAIVFVADSQQERFDANIESYNNMKINLLANKLNPENIPLVIQYNKRDLPNLVSVEELNKAINERNVPHYPTIATTGVGVLEAFHEIGNLLFRHISEKYKVKIQNLTEDVFNVKEVSKENSERFQELKNTEDIPMSLDLTQDDGFDFDNLNDDIINEDSNVYDDMSAYPSAYSKDQYESVIEMEDAESTKKDPVKDAVEKLIKDSTDIIRKQSEILDALHLISNKLKGH